MRAVTPILAISLLVPFAGVQAQGPPSLAQARQQESEVVPTVDFPLVISVRCPRPRSRPVSDHAFSLPLCFGPREQPTSGSAATGVRPPAPTGLSGAAKAIMGAGTIVRAIILMPPINFGGGGLGRR